jgi:MFS family permease
MIEKKHHPKITSPHMEKTHTPQSRWPIIGLLLVQLLTGITLSPAANFFGIYLNEVIGYSIRQVAQVMALGRVAGMFSSLLGGGLSDRWGPKRVWILGVGAIALSSLAFVFRIPWLIVLLWALSGVGLGLTTLGGQSYLTLAAGVSTLGVLSALYNWGYTIGGAIGNPLTAGLLDQFGFTLLGLVLAGIGLCTALVAILLPNLKASTNPLLTVNALPGYRVLLQRRIIILGMLRFLPTCFYGVTTLLPLVIKQQGGSNSAVAYYAAGSAVLASLTQLLAGRASDRWGVHWPTRIAFATILLSIVGIILTAQSLWGLYLFGAVGVSAAWALSTLLPGLVTMAAEPQIRGRVFGMLFLLWTTGMILGTLLGGALLDVDLRLPFLVVGLLNILALSLTVPFFRMNPPQPQFT